LLTNYNDSVDKTLLFFDIKQIKALEYANERLMLGIYEQRGHIDGAMTNPLWHENPRLKFVKPFDYSLNKLLNVCKAKQTNNTVYKL